MKSRRKLDMVWMTKEGREVKVSEMDDRHLLNCIRLLERRAGEIKLKLGLSNRTEEVAASVFAIYDVMVKEMESRLNKPKAPVLVLVHKRFIDMNR